MTDSSPIAPTADFKELLDAFAQTVIDWEGEHIAGNKVIDELRAELASLRDSQK